MTAARKQMRGDQLVAKVFKATLAELTRVGVEHLSIEDVAECANVNKTTIYRRWPTPERLAQAALVCASESHTTLPDTGSLRSDLHAFARELRRLATRPDIRTVMRLRWSETARGPLTGLTREVQDKKHAQWKQLLRRAVVRGELPKSTDIDLVFEVIIGTLIYMVVLGPRRSNAARVNRAVDAILDGVLRPGTGRTRTKRTRQHSGV
jgi:AcrR family transcriptional regulator